MPHVVYLLTWPDGAQYAGQTREGRFELRVNEHRTGNGGLGNPVVYPCVRAMRALRIEIRHLCDNRAEAFALEAQEIEQRLAAGIHLLNKN